MRRAVCLLILMSFMLNSCRKPLEDVNDYFPVVTTVSATVQLDGSVLVKGELESPGEAKGTQMDNVGFCVSTNSDPKMQDHQVIATLDGTSFTTTYNASDFSVDSIYYFRTWATNDYGRAMGNTLAVDSIIATPVVAPCSWSMNYASSGAGPSSGYSNVDAPDSYNFFVGSTGFGSVHYQFGSALTTGFYTTTTSSSPGSGQVYISIYAGFSYGSLNSGSTVYVNRISAGVHDIVICSAPWSDGTSTFYFNTHFITPY
jgi:hypothetical protein